MKKLFLNKNRLIICIILFAICLLVLLLSLIFAIKQNRNDSVVNQNSEQVVSYVAEVTPTLKNDTVVASPTNEPTITAINTPIPTAQTTPQVTAQPTTLPTPTPTPQPTSAYATFRSTHFDFQFSYDYSKFGYAYSVVYDQVMLRNHEKITFQNTNNISGNVDINPAPGGSGGGDMTRSEVYNINAASGQAIRIILIEYNGGEIRYSARQDQSSDGSFYMEFYNSSNPGFITYEQLKTFGDYVISTLSYSNL